jgi:hypothetical protein
MQNARRKVRELFADWGPQRAAVPDGDDLKVRGVIGGIRYRHVSLLV